MNIHNYFKLNRFGLLLKLELMRNMKGIWMTLVIIFGISKVGFILKLIFDTAKVYDEHPSNFGFTLIVGGFILSSLAFNDLSNTLKKYTYLNLPASVFEKFLCMWMLTSVGWIVFYTFAYTLYTLLANQIGHIFFSSVQFMFFNPFGEIPIKIMQYYFVLQGIFLVGAAQFKGYVFPKTLFTLIVFAIVCGLIAYLTMADLIKQDIVCTSVNNPFKNGPLLFIWILLQWIFWWLLAPLCWIITYFSLKDKEV